MQITNITDPSVKHVWPVSSYFYLHFLWPTSSPCQVTAELSDLKCYCFLCCCNLIYLSETGLFCKWDIEESHVILGLNENLIWVNDGHRQCKKIIYFILKFYAVYDNDRMEQADDFLLSTSFLRYHDPVGCIHIPLSTQLK